MFSVISLPSLFLKNSPADKSRFILTVGRTKSNIPLNFPTGDKRSVFKIDSNVVGTPSIVPFGTFVSPLFVYI